MEDEERQNQNEDRIIENTESGLKKTAKATKDKVTAFIKKGLTKLGIKPLILFAVIVLVFAILIAWVTIIDLNGFSNIMDFSISDLFKKNVSIAQTTDKGSYYKINGDIIDKFLEQLNKGYYLGYFDDNEPEEKDESGFKYDPDDADITKADLENLFRTEDYEKYVVKMMRAEYASSYPKLGSYTGEDGTEDSVGNKKDSNGDYAFQGIVEIHRQMINQDGTVGEEFELTYLEYDKFKELTDANNPDAIKYYSFKEDTKTIYYATYKQTEVYQDGEKTNSEYILTENTMQYSSISSMCSMPYNFLFNLLQVTGNPEYVMAVIDLLIEDSDVVLMIQDQLNQTTLTHIETSYKASKTVKEHYRRKGTPPDTYYDITSTSEDYDYPSGEPIVSTTMTLVYTNTATAFIKRANTWCMDYEQEAVANNTETFGEPVEVLEEYEEGTIEQLNYTLVSSNTPDDAEEKSSYTETAYYESDPLLYKTSDKVDTKVYGWTISTVTEKRINHEKFLGLWKNDTGEYYLGSRFDKDGKEVRLYYSRWKRNSNRTSD